MPEIGYARSIIDDTPVNGELEKAPSSNWAYDHAANKDAHHVVFVDRGNALGYDFPNAALTKDSAWHDLDLSALLPAGAIAAALCLEAQVAVVGGDFVLRKKGNSAAYNVSKISSMVVGLWHTCDVIVFVDANRFAQYFFTLGAYSNANITVKGYWI